VVLSTSVAILLCSFFGDCSCLPHQRMPDLRFSPCCRIPDTPRALSSLPDRYIFRFSDPAHLLGASEFRNFPFPPRQPTVSLPLSAHSPLPLSFLSPSLHPLLVQPFFTPSFLNQRSALTLFFFWARPCALPLVRSVLVDETFKSPRPQPAPP